MSYPESVPDRSGSSPQGQRISRRRFVRNVAMFSAVLAGSGLLQGSSPAAAQPPHAQAQTCPATVSEALKNRKSTNAFKWDPLPREKLMDLLWAAWGINRPDSGKRTAPSAMNAQEIDLYVLLADGAYVYDAGQSQLTPVSDRDLRAEAKSNKFTEAPVHLVFVADYAKYPAGTESEQKLWSAAHTGFIGQNVYLYCAAEGLGAHFYASINRAALKDSLQLRADQAIIFGQVVGYPNE